MKNLDTFQEYQRTHRSNQVILKLTAGNLFLPPGRIFKKKIFLAHLQHFFALVSNERCCIVLA